MNKTSAIRKQVESVIKYSGTMYNDLRKNGQRRLKFVVGFGMDAAHARKRLQQARDAAFKAKQQLKKAKIAVTSVEPFIGIASTPIGMLECFSVVVTYDANVK